MDRHAPRSAVKYLFAPMGAGKTTFAIQTFLNLSRVGEAGQFIAVMQKSEKFQSRLLANVESVQVIQAREDSDIQALLDSTPAQRFAVIDDAHLLSASSAQSAVQWADTSAAEVIAFGLLHDFQARLFAGAERFLELADVVQPLLSELRCWCGNPASHHLRVVAGKVQRHGPQTLVGDLASDGVMEEITYASVCRHHWQEGQPRPG